MTETDLDMFMDQFDFLTVRSPLINRRRELVFMDTLITRGLNSQVVPDWMRTRLDRMRARNLFLLRIEQGDVLDGPDGESGFIRKALVENQTNWGRFDALLMGLEFGTEDIAEAARLIRDQLFGPDKLFLKLPAWEHYLESSLRLDRIDTQLQPQLEVVGPQPKTLVVKIRGSHQSLKDALGVSDEVKGPDKPDLNVLYKVQRNDAKEYTIDVISWAQHRKEVQEEALKLIKPFDEWAEMGRMNRASSVVADGSDNDADTGTPGDSNAGSTPPAAPSTPPSQNGPAAPAASVAPVTSGTPGAPSADAPAAPDSGSGEAPTPEAAATTSPANAPDAEKPESEAQVAVNTPNLKISTTVEHKND